MEDCVCGSYCIECDDCTKMECECNCDEERLSMIGSSPDEDLEDDLEEE